MEVIRHFLYNSSIRTETKKGGRQTRSVSRMPSDDLAGDAKRRVPIPKKEGGYEEDPVIVQYGNVHQSYGKQNEGSGQGRKL